MISIFAKGGAPPFCSNKYIIKLLIFQNKYIFAILLIKLKFSKNIKFSRTTANNFYDSRPLKI